MSRLTDLNSTDSRAQFERCALRRWYLELDRSMLLPDNYRDSQTQIAWEAWKAGYAEALFGLKTLSEAAQEAGVSRQWARAKLLWTEERGFYTAMRVGNAIIVDERFVKMLKGEN